VTKTLIQSPYNNPNVVRVLPASGRVYKLPQTIEVWFDVPVRNVSIQSNLSTTEITKELITITNRHDPLYENLEYRADQFPNNITKEIHIVKFDYYFTDSQTAILDYEFEKYVNSAWVEDTLQVILSDERDRRYLLVDNNIGVTDENNT